MVYLLLTVWKGIYLFIIKASHAVNTELRLRHSLQAGSCTQTDFLQQPHGWRFDLLPQYRFKVIYIAELTRLSYSHPPHIAVKEQALINTGEEAHVQEDAAND